MKWLAAVFIIAALLIFAHHYYIHKRWFDKKDVMNHEVIALTLLAFAGGILIAG